ncbi:VanZ family protein [Winogradskyella sp. PE311]|uniref:VanZ family protein n=1 Tax=Winogradskyella sp. PE311 TaxID=3366943 RepID=UPI0039817777
MLKSKSIQLIALLFFLFIVWIIYSANVGNQTIFFDFVSAIPFGDKLGHFFLFGIFTLFLNLALDFKPMNLFKKIPLGTVIISICIILEELSQVFFPNRTLDALDLIADILGILTFTYIGFLFENKIPSFQE